MGISEIKSDPLGRYHETRVRDPHNIYRIVEQHEGKEYLLEGFLYREPHHVIGEVVEDFPFVVADNSWYDGLPHVYPIITFDHAKVRAIDPSYPLNLQPFVRVRRERDLPTIAEILGKE